LITESVHQGNSQIEIITTASKIPKEVGPEYAKALEYLGAKMPLYFTLKIEKKLPTGNC